MKRLLVGLVALGLALVLVQAAPAQEPLVVDLSSTDAAARIVGAAPIDLISQVAVGDVNGDGLGDIIIGAPHAERPKGSPEAGAVYVIFGVAGLSGTMDLAAAKQNVVIYGDGPVDLFGQAVAAGDVNGDGIDDIIVGSQADGPENERPNAGQVDVIFGGAFSKSIGIDKGQQDVTIFGADAFDDAGHAVASGDVNGDGIDDIIIGADDAAGPDNSRPNSGEVYVIFGGPSLSATIDLAAGGADATVLGAESGDDVGTSLATGDANGDGRDDVLAGADDAAGPANARPDAGEAHLISGAALNGTVDLATSEVLTILGADVGDNLGSAVAMGDVSGDGLADLIVGADSADGPGNSRTDAGEAYVILGSTSLVATIDIAAGQQSLTVVGASARDTLGAALATGTTANGDGIADLVIAADDGDGPDEQRINTGEVYVIAGSAGLSGTLDIANDPQALTIIGADAIDDLGVRIAVGDVRGGDRAEVVSSAPKADGPNNGRPEAGEVYVISTGDSLDGSPGVDVGGNLSAGQQPGVGGASADDGVRVGNPDTGAGPAAGRPEGWLSWFISALALAGTALLGSLVIFRAERAREEE